MKILIVNTSELSGGAALAASRLKDALNKQGEKAMMLVRDKQSDDPTVVGIGGGLGSSLRFLWERVRILLSLRFNRSHLFDLDTGYCGFDITRLKEFRDADVVHLHWVNQGMLSLTGLRRILESGKPVVWTMHDAWPSTAICHLTLGCHRYQSGCQRCKYLPGGGSTNDLSASIWKRKQSILKGKSLTFVACSRWLAAEAGRSKLLKGQHITAIPNPIDTHLFRPGDKDEARKRLGLPADKRLILFAAQRATNSYKGMDYLQAACNKLTAAHPELAADTAVGSVRQRFDHRPLLFDVGNFLRFFLYAFLYRGICRKTYNNALQLLRHGVFLFCQFRQALLFALDVTLVFILQKLLCFPDRRLDLGNLPVTDIIIL